MKALLTVAVLVVLALLVSSRRLWRLRRSRLGAVVVSGGWLPVLLGFLLGPRITGLVDQVTLRELSPLLQLCLCWVGLLVGFQLHRRLREVLPPRAAAQAFTDALLSLLVGGLAAYLVLGDAPPRGRLTAAVLLGLCTVSWMADAWSLRGDGSPGRRATDRLRATSGLGSVLAIAGYGLLFKTWDAPLAGASPLSVAASIGFGLAVSVIVALAAGLLCDWLVRLAEQRENEFLVVLLGFTAYTAGAAAALGYSPLFVGALTGAVVINLRSRVLDRLKRVILAAEQPFAMGLLLLAGAMADPRVGVVGLLLIAALLGARLAVKSAVGAWAFRREAREEGAPYVAVGPLRQAPLALVLLVGFHAATQGGALGAGLDSGHLLAILIAVGVLADGLAVALALRAARRGATA